jgi:hypothetical protein
MDDVEGSVGDVLRFGYWPMAPAETTFTVAAVAVEKWRSQKYGKPPPAAAIGSATVDRIVIGAAQHGVIDEQFR